MEKEKKSKKKFLIIAVLFACFISLGIGYAYLAQDLNLNFNGTIDSDFKVEFQQATEVTGQDLGEVVLSSSGDNGINDTATITVTVNKPGDSYVATIPVQNTDEITAHYVGMTPGGSNSAVPQDFVVTFEAPEDVATDIAAGSQHVFTFTFTWTDTDAEQTVPENTTLTFTWTLNYQQAD